MDQAENLELLKVFEGLRAADVRDGMDSEGYYHYGSVNPKFRPMAGGIRTIGIAKTARFLPYAGTDPNSAPGEECDGWIKESSASAESGAADAFWSDIRPGDFVCLDLADTDCGVIDSADSLRLRTKDCAGYLVNGGARDIDEMISQKIPVWAKPVSQRGVSGFKASFYEADIPVAIGGAAIYPGDVVVADGDGVVVVPRGIAREVGEWARGVIVHDKVDRKSHYVKLGMELDDTVL